MNAALNGKTIASGLVALAITCVVILAASRQARAEAKRALACIGTVVDLDVNGGLGLGR